MKIIIFGGSGFVGRSVVQQLAKAGHQLIIPTRSVQKCLPLKPLGDVGQITPVLLSSMDAIQSLLQGADAVVNLLGILAEKGKATFQRIHQEWPKAITEAATKAGVKHLVHVSAVGADAGSESRYAVSKAAGEAAVRAAFPSAVILRPSLVFGAGDGFFELFGRLLPYAPILPLYNHGTTKFQPVYVGDVARAVVASLTIHGKTLELGGTQVYTFKQLLQGIMAQQNSKRCLINIPAPLAYVQAFMMEFMPKPLLTRDQLRLLKTDNVAASDGFAALGIKDITPLWP